MKKDRKKENRFASTEIKKTKYVNEDYQKALSFIVVLVIVLILIGLLFYLNGKYVTKDEFQNTTTTTTAVSYDDTVITVNKIFKIRENKFMVLLYDKSEKETSILYDGLVTRYSGESNLYSVDLSNKMNSSYYDVNGKENKKPTSINDIVITKPTLIIFEKGKVSSYITDTDEIVKNLTKKAEN